jgi:hypothetical protein
MAAGVDADLAGSPWIFVFNGSTATHTLPYTVIGPQNGTNMAYPWLPKRIRWVSKTAAAGDEVIIKDYPGINPTSPSPTNQREVVHFVASGADQDGVDESRPRGHESYVGMQITTFSSGTLYIYW